MLNQIPEVQKTIKPISRKEAKQIELFGQASNMDAYKSRYDLHISGDVSELDQFVTRDFQMGSGITPIYHLKFHGSLN